MGTLGEQIVNKGKKKKKKSPKKSFPVPPHFFPNKTKLDSTRDKPSHWLHETFIFTNRGDIVKPGV
jgi:hypothetical protein